MNYLKRPYFKLLLVACFIILTLNLHHVPNTYHFPEMDILLDEIIIIFNSEINYNDDNLLLQTHQEQMSVIEQFDNYALCKLHKNQDAVKLLQTLNSDHRVAIAEINSELKLQEFFSDPDDTQWSAITDYNNIENTSITTFASYKSLDLNVIDAWNIYYSNSSTSKEVIVALLDTGVDVNHPDLIGRIWNNSLEIPGDGIDNDNNGYIDDVEGWDFFNNDNTVSHYNYNTNFDSRTSTASPLDNDDHGTHCAGIIAANSNNKIGIAGIASNINVKIMPLKIHGGPNGKGTVADAIKAVKYATMMGADICNMSWGSNNYSAALEAAMRESTMLFVTAAGNSGANNDFTPLYPACYDLDNLISVTFIDHEGNLTNDSNYGASSVDIIAPGLDILSTIVGGYGTMSGSSMATPHISAIAAMLYSTGDNLYAANVKEIITSSLKPMNHLKGLIKYPGLPDAALVVSSLNKLKQDNLSPSIELATRYEKDKIIVDINTDDFTGSGIRTIKYVIGNRPLNYFKKGTNGLSISDNVLSLSKAGVYTFYVSDYAGNENTRTYVVNDDNDIPNIKTSYKVSDDYSKITVTINATDFKSGVKTVKYASGIKYIDDFRTSNSGTMITLDADTGSFELTTPGRYTIYAQDYRGNKAIAYLNAKIVKSTNIILNRTSKILGIGKFFRLWPTLVPNNSTDIITYKSSNPSVATVSKWGLLKGISPGKATITATTSSGVKSTCIVTVRYPNDN